MFSASAAVGNQKIEQNEKADDKAQEGLLVFIARKHRTGADKPAQQRWTRVVDLGRFTHGDGYL